MKKNYCELILILDKSGSMNGLEGDTIGGFNANIKKHLELSGDVRVTTVLFNNTYTLLHDRIDIQAISPMTENEYQVGGSTALLDALGDTIFKIRNVQKQTAQQFRAEDVIFVIITDGQENSSKQYKYSDIKKMIEHQQKKYNWKFVFLGANIDIFSEAEKLGIPFNHALSFVSNNIGVGNAWGVATACTSMFRECKQVNVNSISNT